ncbi:MAG: ADP-dependent ribose-1-phosphate kinase [Candidatus Woesearchaeota archaeon]|nr:ADP-dependent ribose-1-phosphate kinase [Candidatus Woesearchaeota archaeon]
MIYGIGNPIVDILVKVEDDLLSELGMPKGIMSLVDINRSKQIQHSVRLHDKTIMPGGSCCNTMIGVANLGGTAAFKGVVGIDQYGDVFKEKLKEFGVFSELVHHNGQTGSSVILVTPDGERTMNTHLGVCGLLAREHIVEKSIKSSKILHTTAYALDTFPDATKHAIDIAKQNNVLVSFDVADPFLVKQKKHEIKEIVKLADIAFLNKEEARLFTGKKPIEAINQISRLCDNPVVKTGVDGCFVKNNGKTVKVNSYKVNALDTTGAGDMFAAGYLFGMLNDFSNKRAAKIGNYSASRIVEVMGARLDYSLMDKLPKEI